MKIKKLYKPGQNSTGPKTPEGKESASQNSTQHGCTARKHFILPSESHSEYQALEDSYFEEYMPLGPMDERFLLRVAELEWVRNRCDRHVQNKRTLFYDVAGDPTNWTDEQHKAIDLLEKYFTRADRAWRNAWRDLQSLRRDRIQNYTANEKARTAVHHNKNKLGMAPINRIPYADLPADLPEGDANERSTPKQVPQ